MSVQPESYPDVFHDTYYKTLTGFWIYLMTDCILFCVLFSTYGVLYGGTYGGPTSKELFDLNTAFIETAVLLVSSFASGLGMLAAVRGRKKELLFWFGLAFILGGLFLLLELTEFGQFIKEGNSWKRSAFLSSYFTLVGTHGLHVTFGLFFMIVVLMGIWRQGITAPNFKRLACLSLFWHFLDVVWIFIFTFVYLMGVG